MVFLLARLINIKRKTRVATAGKGEDSLRAVGSASDLVNDGLLEIDKDWGREATEKIKERVVSSRQETGEEKGERKKILPTVKQSCDCSQSLGCLAPRL